MTTTRELRASFAAEAGELLDALGDQLSALAATPEDPALLNAVFRTFHSIKGGAGFAGADATRALCHRAEELLGAARAHKIVLTDRCFVCLQQVADALQAMVQALGDGDVADCGPDTGLLRELDSLCRDLVGKSEHSAMTDEAFDRLLDGRQRSRSGGTSEAAKQRPSVLPERRNSARVEVRDLDVLVDVALRIHDDCSRLVSATWAADPVRGSLQGLLRDVRELEAVVEGVCLQPLGPVLPRFERTVRGLARGLGKDIVFEASGADVRVPRVAMDALAESVVHVVRNAVDHGIETPEERGRIGKPREGHISLRAAVVGGEIQIGVGDDGRGMNADALRMRAIETGLIREDEARLLNRAMCLDLAFLPGFTTRAKPSDVSGRGVGLDVVRLNLRRVGGSAYITSSDGLGTTVWIYIPLRDPFPSSVLHKAIESWID